MIRSVSARRTLLVSISLMFAMAGALALQTQSASGDDDPPDPPDPLWPHQAELELNDHGDAWLDVTWPLAEPAEAIEDYTLRIRGDAGLVTYSFDRDGDTFVESNNEGEVDYDKDNREFTFRTPEDFDISEAEEFEISISVPIYLDENNNEALVAEFIPKPPDIPVWDDSTTATTENVLDTTATVTFDQDPTSPGGHSLEDYVVLDDAGEELGLEWSAFDQTFGSLNVFGLEPSSSTTVTVEVIDEFGQMSNSGPSVTIDTLSADSEPFDLQVVPAEARPWPVLNWDGPRSGEYEVHRQVTGSGDSPELMGTVAGRDFLVHGDPVRFVDVSAESDTGYTYEVRWTAGEFESDPVADDVTTTGDGSIARASLTTGGTQGRDSSNNPSIDESGRYVIFDSAHPFTDDAAEAAEDNGEIQLFLRDLETSQTELISYDDDGEPVADGVRFGSSVSPDGNWVAYAERIERFQSPDDTYVYLHDRSSGSRQPISPISEFDEDPVAPEGRDPIVTENAEYVVFQSSDPDLAIDPDEASNNVYIWDRQANDTEEITLGQQQQSQPHISPNGDYVVFRSDRHEELIGESGGGEYDVFLLDRTDRDNPEIELIEVAEDGGDSDGSSDIPQVSNDGDVVFRSIAENLTDDPIDSGIGTPTQHVFHYSDGVLQLLSKAPDGSPGDDDSRFPTISADGSRVTFTSLADNLSPLTDVNEKLVYVYDVETDDSPRPLAVNYEGDVIIGWSADAMISPGGESIAFQADATAENVVPNNTNNESDIVVAQVSNAETSAPDHPTGFDLEELSPFWNLFTWNTSLSDAAYVYIYQRDRLVATAPAGEGSVIAQNFMPFRSTNYQLEIDDRYGNISTNGPMLGDIPDPTTWPSDAEITIEDTGQSFVELSWPEFDGADEYRITDNGEFGTTSDTGIVIDGLILDTEYQMSVEAHVEGEGWSDRLTKTVTTRGAGEARLWLELEGPETVALEWEELSNGTPVGGYEVRRTVSGEDDWEPIATTDDETIQHEDSGLDPDTEYDYQIYVEEPGGDAEQHTEVASITTAAIQSIDITVADEELDLGDSTTATAEATWESFGTLEVTEDADWSSNDSSIVSIDTNGDVTLTGESEGTSVVTAIFGGVTSNAVEVTVVDETDDSDPIDPTPEPPDPEPDGPTMRNVPGHIVVDAESPDGAIVDYDLPTAHDDQDGDLTVTCEPAPGSLFAVGHNTIECSATNNDGETVKESFAIIVLPYDEPDDDPAPDRPDFEPRDQIENPHFDSTWSRSDLPVRDGHVSRTWMWGPGPFTESMSEPYQTESGANALFLEDEQIPETEREVIYFDKSRMEINDPDADPGETWFVTNGLLVVEMITGKRQFGDDLFIEFAPAEIGVAGDPDDEDAPTYASLADLLDEPAQPVGTLLTQAVDRDGDVHDNPEWGNYGVEVGHVDEVTDHGIADPFWDFMNSDGLIFEDGELREGDLFENPFYATGRPITEAYWTSVLLDGETTDVLLQCFERRCLTYTPGNPDGYVVEAGNVGQHYYAWRYIQEPDP